MLPSLGGGPDVGSAGIELGSAPPDSEGEAFGDGKQPPFVGFDGIVGFTGGSVAPPSTGGGVPAPGSWPPGGTIPGGCSGGHGL